MNVNKVLFFFIKKPNKFSVISILPCLILVFLYRSKLILFALSILICMSNGVDKTNFKSCTQSSFCKRCRTMEPNKSNFKLLVEKTEIAPSSLRSQLVDTKYNVYYSFYLYAIENGIFRFKINELNPEKIRFEVPYVLEKNLTLAK